MNQSQPLDHPDLLDRFRAALADEPRARAAFIRGAPHDAYESLDLCVVVRGIADEALLELSRELLARAGRALWISTLSISPLRLRALYPGPLRLDLTIGALETLPPYDGQRVLLDKDALLGEPAMLARHAEPLRPEHVLRACDEFWWNIFSSVEQLKRGQLWMALHLLDSCRDGLSQMMRWRRDPSQPAERFADLERHLSAEDQQALAQTLAGYELRAITEALLCAADAFDPAARDVAARVGVEYPAVLAHEIKVFFIREFWALLAPGPAISA